MPVQKHEQSRHEHESRRRSQESIPIDRRKPRKVRVSDGDAKTKFSSRQATDASLSKISAIQKDTVEETSEQDKTINDRHADVTTENDASENEPKMDASVMNQSHEDAEESPPPRQTTISQPISGASPPKPKPEPFTIEKFNHNMDGFVETFASDKYMHVTDNYPVEELVSVVGNVKTSVEEFKQQTVSSQHHLEELSETMRRVKEKIQTNIQRKSNIIRVGKYYLKTSWSWGWANLI